MANHGFLTTRKQLTPEQVDRDIKEIIERRLGGIIKVTFDTYKDEPSKDGHWAGWQFKPKEGTVKEGHFEFGAWLNSRRKMEFRHPHGEWSWWAQMILQQELALKYNGTISDEGVEERWKVTPRQIKKYFHYRDWVFRNCDQTQDVVRNATRHEWAKLELTYTPEPLRSL
jgi:hypothetical protein